MSEILKTLKTNFTTLFKKFGEELEFTKELNKYKETDWQ